MIKPTPTVRFDASCLARVRGGLGVRSAVRAGDAAIFKLTPDKVEAGSENIRRTK